MPDRHAFVFESRLDLTPGTDPRAPGGAITVALCGSWDHDGPCRWPHHNDLDSSSSPARLRTVVVADDASRPDVVARIEHALRADERWSVASCTTGPPTAGERPLAERLAR